MNNQTLPKIHDERRVYTNKRTYTTETNNKQKQTEPHTQPEQISDWMPQKHDPTPWPSLLIPLDAEPLARHSSLHCITLTQSPVTRAWSNGCEMQTTKPREWTDVTRAWSISNGYGHCVVYFPPALHRREEQIMGTRSWSNRKKIITRVVFLFFFFSTPYFAILHFIINLSPHHSKQPIETRGSYKRKKIITIVSYFLLPIWRYNIPQSIYRLTNNKLTNKLIIDYLKSKLHY